MCRWISGELAKIQGPGLVDSAFLTSSWAMPMLLAQGPHFAWQGARLSWMIFSSVAIQPVQTFRLFKGVQERTDQMSSRQFLAGYFSMIKPTGNYILLGFLEPYETSLQLSLHQTEGSPGVQKQPLFKSTLQCWSALGESIMRLRTFWPASVSPPCLISYE